MSVWYATIILGGLVLGVFSVVVMPAFGCCVGGGTTLPLLAERERAISFPPVPAIDRLGPSLYLSFLSPLSLSPRSLSRDILRLLAAKKLCLQKPLIFFLQKLHFPQI